METMNVVIEELPKEILPSEPKEVQELIEQESASSFYALFV